MEYIDGGTLEAIYSVDKPAAGRTPVESFSNAPGRSTMPTAQGVIHRDIKPANILRARRCGAGEMKISDFGVALIQATNKSVDQVHGVGSPAYMSPEQIQEPPARLRPTSGSLGVVFYQLLTGRLPFQASNNFSMMYQITNVEPLPPSSLRPDIPPAADRIVRKAMQKELEQRYRDWDEFSDDLAAVISSEQAARKDEFADSEKFNILRDLPFFADFGDAELWEVMRISSWEYCKPGKALMFDGNSGISSACSHPVKSR